MSDRQNIIIERHPWEAFIPDGAKVLIMGTFPPPMARWSMDFFYPNPINDFWRIMSLLFLGDVAALYDSRRRAFDVEAVRRLAAEHKIALSDTGYEVVRHKGNASDKFLEIVRPVDFDALISRMPDCRDVATTGEKAARVLADLTDTVPPKMGEFVVSRNLRIWRMPSTSRAYPMRLEQKAAYYRILLEKAGLLDNL